jgi:hypothetical protein
VRTANLVAVDSLNGQLRKLKIGAVTLLAAGSSYELSITFTIGGTAFLVHTCAYGAVRQHLFV